MDNRTEQLADGVWRVEVGWFVNAYVLANDGHSDAEGLTAIDTGAAAGGPRLVRSIRMLGFDPLAVTDVLCTHWHADHAGSAERFAASSARPIVRAPEGADLDVVARGADPPVPTPGRSTRSAGWFARRARRPRACPTAQPLRPGDRWAAGGGCLAVAAPGHTPAHTAFWLAARGVLLAGDALVTVPRPWLGPRTVTADLPAARATLRQLAALEPAVVAVGHGRPLRDRPASRLGELGEAATPGA